jgi:ParB/RepB/Spo0J family partition protein
MKANKGNDTPEIALALIDANPNQPRRRFNQASLEELAASIREQGVVEPVVLTPRNGRYLLVAGERRTRAAKLAGLTTIPACIKLGISDKTVQELALLENVQREDLTPMEEARAYQDFIDRGYTLDGLTKLLGYKHPWGVIRPLRLLKLRPRYQEALEKEWITKNQAFHLSRLEPVDQDVIFHAIRDGKCDTEERLKAMVDAVEDRDAQSAMFRLGTPDPRAKEVIGKYTRLLDRLTDLLNRSFDAEDLAVLRRVLEGDVQGNLQRLELIVEHLTRIRKALLGQAATQQLLNGVQR